MTFDKDSEATLAQGMDLRQLLGLSNNLDQSLGYPLPRSSCVWSPQILDSEVTMLEVFTLILT